MDNEIREFHIDSGKSQRLGRWSGYLGSSLFKSKSYPTSLWFWLSCLFSYAQFYYLPKGIALFHWVDVMLV